MPKYLNADGVRLMIQTLMESIKEAFTLKSDAVKSIRRNGTTFTATRADGTTFTFDQQDASVEKSSTTPLENGVAAVGDENKYAAGNHVHPHDSTKVDKVDGKGLSSNDYTSTEKEKLSELPTASDLSDALGQKVNKVAGKGLSSNDYTSEEKSKLSALPTSAGLVASLNTKVDKVSGKGLSTNDFTNDYKTKLEALPDSGDLENDYEKKTYKHESGSVVTFEDGANDKPVYELAINIEPVVEEGCGKNLYNKENGASNFYYNASTEKLANSSNTRSVYIPCEPNTTYTVSKTAGSRFSVCYTEIEPATGVDCYGGIVSNAASSITITTGADAAYLVAYVWYRTIDSAEITDSEMLASVQIEKGASATAYEPYTTIRSFTGWTGVNIHVSPTTDPGDGRTYSVTFPSEAGTVYGGVLDLTAGTLTVTHGFRQLSAAVMNQYGTASSGVPYARFVATSGAAETGDIYCDRYEGQRGAGAESGAIRVTPSGATYIYDNRFTDEATARQILDDEKPFLIYPLAEPVVYQLTPVQITTLPGENNVWADCGSILSLEYINDSGWKLLDNVSIDPATTSKAGLMGASDKSKLDGLPDSETLSEVYAKKKLDSKTFTDVIGTAANWANATFFFGTIYPESYYATWKIQYRIYAEAAGSDESKAIADVTVSGTQSKLISYSSFNSIANTSYRPAYDHELYRATSDGYEAGYGHALGVRLYSAWQPANPVNARTFSIDILSAENCEFEFYDSMMLYADIPGTGSTNYSDYSELNFLDNGLQETGDTNQIDRLQVPTASWLAGTNGLKAYGLFMQDADGAYQSFTLTNGTAATKAKNPVGFVPGKVWYLYSSANVAAGSSSSAGVGYISYPFDFRYSSNCASTLTNDEPVYIVFTEGNDGLVYLADVWWAQSLPTTEDGYVYMYLGQVYTNRRSIHLSPFHPMYKFYDGAVREWFPGMRRTATSSSDGLMSASDKAKLDSITPLRMNNGVLEYYDGSAWAAVPLGQ